MLESNTFRSMMLIGGVITLAALITGFFTTPLVDINPQEKAMYENIRHEDLGDATDLTLYQAMLFAVEGKIRGNVQHY